MVSRSSVSDRGRLADVEPGVVMARHCVVPVHAIDARARRSVSEAMLEAIDGLGLTFGVNLDPPITQLPDPAVDSLARRRCLGEKPEPDPLNPAADDEMPRETHAERTRLYTPLSGPLRHDHEPR